MAADAIFFRLELLHDVATALLRDDPVGWQRHAASRTARALRIEEAVAEAVAEVQDSSSLLFAAQAARTRWYYKAVAKVDGRYLSIFDGQTEFKLGERIARIPALGHRGAFFAYDTIEAARDQLAAFPKGSKLIKADRALLRVSGNVPRTEARRAHGKAMLWAMTPLEEVPLKTTGRRRRLPPARPHTSRRETPLVTRRHGCGPVAVEAGLSARPQVGGAGSAAPGSGRWGEGIVAGGATQRPSQEQRLCRAVAARRSTGQYS
jgi:hypothetical protein